MVRLLEISHKYGICSLFTGKCNFGVVPGGAIAPYFKPHRGAFAAFPKQNDKCRGGGGACFELTEPLNVGSTEVLYCFLENLTFPFVVTCAILVLLDYRKRREELRSSKKQQRTAMHSKFSV